MNNLCADIGYRSIYHDGEELCGDHIDVIEQEDGDSTVVVLADGLGSGVKASILSTLTSKIISTMIAAGLSLEDCRCRRIAATLPVCSVSARLHIPPLPFCALWAAIAGVELIQYDNPRCYNSARRR